MSVSGDVTPFACVDLNLHEYNTVGHVAWEWGAIRETISAPPHNIVEYSMEILTDRHNIEEYYSGNLIFARWTKHILHSKCFVEKYIYSSAS